MSLFGLTLKLFWTTRSERNTSDRETMLLQHSCALSRLTPSLPKKAQDLRSGDVQATTVKDVVAPYTKVRRYNKAKGAQLNLAATKAGPRFGSYFGKL